MTQSPQTFSEAVDAFRSVRSNMNGDSVELADRALDALLAKPSSSVTEFGEKLSALVSEYGKEWQPRHISALMADTAILGASCG